LWGARIINNEVDVKPLWHRLVEGIEEPPKLARPVALVKLADDLAALDIQRGEQCRRPVACVVVSTPLGVARSHRQDRLGAIEGLDLRLLVDTYTAATQS
jgi:hypothetical protein